MLNYLPLLLTLIMFTAKVFGVITWSWLIVFCPLLIPLVFFLLVFGGAVTWYLTKFKN